MTIDEAKAQAKALRAALQAQGNTISQALELVARQHGAKDWNTLHARLALVNASPELALGDRVRGRYLGQAFAGRVVGLSGPSTHRQIEVRFERFSNLRNQVRSVIDKSGRSHRHTSDGRPQLIVERDNGCKGGVDRSPNSRVALPVLLAGCGRINVPGPFRPLAMVVYCKSSALRAAIADDGSCACAPFGDARQSMRCQLANVTVGTVKKPKAARLARATTRNSDRGKNAVGGLASPSSIVEARSAY